jgi:hypothetical protein
MDIFLPRRLLNATAARSLKNIEQVKEDPPQRGGPSDRDDYTKPEHKDCCRPADRQLALVLFMSVGL